MRPVDVPGASSRADGRRRRWVPAAVAAALVVSAGALIVATAPTAAAATVDTNASYVLLNRGSGKALDVYNLATNNGARIVQWARNDGAQQQWQFVDSGNGYYRLKSRLSGKVLDVYNWSTANGGAIVQYTDYNQSNQQFRLQDVDGGYVTLISRHSGKAVEVQGASNADGAAVVQYTSWGGANQQWQLVRVDGGSTPTPTPTPTPPPARGCTVRYTTNDWPGGFTASVRITNTSGASLSSWSLGFTFPGDQRVTNGWSGTYGQAGQAVTVTHAPWNGTIPAGASTEIGFNGSFTGANPRPAGFTLNGTPCEVG